MTTTTEGVQLTQIGPGTVMGDLMRQYLIPAALSSELERDSAPIKLMLLGEKLIAFRDSTICKLCPSTKPNPLSSSKNATIRGA